MDEQQSCHLEKQSENLDFCIYIYNCLNYCFTDSLPENPFCHKWNKLNAELY